MSDEDKLLPPKQVLKLHMSIFQVKEGEPPNQKVFYMFKSPDGLNLGFNIPVYMKLMSWMEVAFNRGRKKREEENNGSRIIKPGQ